MKRKILRTEEKAVRLYQFFPLPEVAEYARLSSLLGTAVADRCPFAPEWTFSHFFLTGCCPVE